MKSRIVGTERMTPIAPIATSWRSQQLVTVVAFVTAALLIIAQHWVAGRGEFIDAVRAQAAMIGDSANAALVFSDENTADDVVAAARRYPNVESVAIYRAGGDLLAGQAADSTSIAPRIEPIARADTRLTLYGLEADLPIVFNGRVVGGVRMHVSRWGFYQNQLEFVGSLVVIVVLTFAIYSYTSTHLRKRVAGAEEALRHLALHDPVTRLPNRHAFEFLLEQTFRLQRRDNVQSALLFIDVDDFKKVNDLFGHPVGDEALRMIAENFRSVIRDSDVIARMGGDEFGAILRDTRHADDAARLAEELIALMSKPLPIGEHQVHLGLSIGIAMIPRDGATVQDLQRHADMAMYRAKKEGKGTYRFFSQNIGDEVAVRHDIEAQLRAALAADQLYVNYQPQVDSRDGTIRGLEALLRWRHARLGQMSPAVFIPIAEESDLILDIGDWVLRQVLRDIQTMNSMGISPLPVAINVSARQFARRDIAALIRAELDKAGLGPERIEIELTESVLMEHTGRALTSFDAIRDSGLHLAIDDFGTGYSSLAYLKRLPVSKLKIDRAFVVNLTDKEEDRAIVRAVIHLADALGLRVVAEGVESEEQGAILKKMGCDVFQGYLTGRPAPLEQVLTRLRKVA